MGSAIQPPSLNHICSGGVRNFQMGVQTFVAGKYVGSILHFFSNKIQILGGSNEPPEPPLTTPLITLII